MLSGLAVCAVITALIAGVTGAWSPCGFSMVETIGTALGDSRRTTTLAASTTFAIGALIGGAVTFGALALVGHMIEARTSGLRDGLGAVLALAAAIADWRGVKIAPQIRRQVPERWRWTTPLPIACGLYGVLLGLAFTTFVLSFAVWALAGISFASGDPAIGLLVGVAFGAGRAVPILWMAPSLRRGAGARRLDALASEPRLWLGLRRLDAIGLSLCALFLSGASATAAALPAATDPSAAGGELAWQGVSGPGMLLAQPGQATILPGNHPALGGSLIAWVGASQITVADASSLATVTTFGVPGANALAISAGWLVYRAVGAGGEENLVGMSLLGSAPPREIASSKFAAEIGRPTLDGSDVVFTVDSQHRNEIDMVDLETGARRLLRSANSGFTLTNPSVLEGRLLYERVDRCSQKLLIGPLARSRYERTLLNLPSTVKRDPGFESGYEHAYNRASLCSNRRTGRGSAIRLGPTTLSASTAFVTEISSSPEAARVIGIARY